MIEPTEKYYYTFKNRSYWTDPRGNIHTDINFDPLGGVIDGYDTAVFNSYEEYKNSSLYHQINLGYTGLNVCQKPDKCISREEYFNILKSGFGPLIIKYKSNRNPLYENNLKEFFDHGETPTSDFYGKFEKGAIWVSAEGDLTNNIEFDPLGGAIDGYNKYIYENFESLYKSPFIKLYSILIGPWSNDDAGLREANQYFRYKVGERGPLIVMAKDKNRKSLYEGREDETPTEEYYFKPDKEGYRLWFNPRHSATYVVFDDIDGFADGYATIHFNNFNELANSFVSNLISKINIPDFRHFFAMAGPITFKVKDKDRKPLYEEYEDHSPTADFYYKPSNSKLMLNNHWYDPEGWRVAVDFDPLGGAIDGYEMAKFNTYDDLVDSDLYKHIIKKDTVKYFINWEDKFHNEPLIFMIKDKDRKPLYEEYKDNSPTADFYYKPSNPKFSNSLGLLFLTNNRWYDPEGWLRFIDFDPLGGAFDGYEMVKFNTFDDFINSDVYKRIIKKDNEADFVEQLVKSLMMPWTVNFHNEPLTFMIKDKDRKPLYESFEDEIPANADSISPIENLYFKPINSKLLDNHWYNPDGWRVAVEFDPIGGIIDGYKMIKFNTYDEFINSDVYKENKDTERGSDSMEDSKIWKIRFKMGPLIFMIKDKDRKPLYENYEEKPPTKDYYYAPKNNPNDLWRHGAIESDYIDFDTVNGYADGYDTFEFNTMEEFENSDIFDKIMAWSSDDINDLFFWLKHYLWFFENFGPVVFKIKNDNRKSVWTDLMNATNPNTYNTAIDEELKKIKRLNEAINQMPITKQTATTKQYQATIDKSPLIKNRAQQIDSMYEFPSAFETWFDSLGIKDKPGISQSALIARMKDIMNKMGVK